jgi:hypothetical protein
MAVNQLLVNSYATNIYLLGKNSFSNIALTRPEYVEPVKQRGADHYYIDEIDTALTKGYITPSEHADTLALKEADDPQYSPPITLMVATEPTA